MTARTLAWFVSKTSARAVLTKRVKARTSKARTEAALPRERRSLVNMRRLSVLNNPFGNVKRIRQGDCIGRDSDPQFRFLLWRQPCRLRLPITIHYSPLTSQRLA